MHRNLKWMAILLSLAALVHASAGRTEVLDRIVAVINGKAIITLSDIRKERSILTALGKPATNDTRIREDLIDRYLVEEQIAQFAGIQVSEEEIQSRMAEIKDPLGLPAADLRKAVIAEISRTEFIIQRFQQFIRVSDEEMEQYYRTVFLPSLKPGSTPPSLTEVADAIRREVVYTKLDREVMAWLEDLRRRNDVEIFEP